MSSDYELGSIAKALHERNRIEQRRNEIFRNGIVALENIAITWVAGLTKATEALESQAVALREMNATFEMIGGILADAVDAPEKPEPERGPATLSEDEIEPMGPADV